MAYGVWGGGGEEDRELEYRESEDDEVGRIFYYGLGGGAAGAGGRISWRERRWGKTAQNLLKQLLACSVLRRPAQTTLSCPPLHPR